MIQYAKIFTGPYCNNDCTCCPHTDSDRSMRPIEEILEQIDEAKTKGLNSAYLYGGEPELRYDLKQITDYLQKQGFTRIKLSSNGRAFSQWKRVEESLNKGIFGYEIKLVGSKVGTHDRITQVEGSFSQTVQGIVNLRNSGDPATGRKPFVGLKVLLSEDNIDDAQEIVSLGVSLRVDRIILSLASSGLKITDVLPILRGSIEIAVLNKLWISTDGVPLCMLNEYESHWGELFGLGLREGEKGNKCEKCSVFDVCNGVLSGYLDKFGDAELLPLKKGQQLGIIKKIAQAQNV